MWWSNQEKTQYGPHVCAHVNDVHQTTRSVLTTGSSINLFSQASTYEKLLERFGQYSLNDMRIQHYLLLTFKVIHGFNLPGYLRDMIRLRSSANDLRGSYWLETEYQG